MGNPAAAVTPWKLLLIEALNSNSHLKYSTYLQLATVGSNGRPSNRTVVYRGFLEDTDKIQIYTDIRSRKIEEISNCPYAEICWYFIETWEQFRINGRLEIIDSSNPDNVKLQYREKAWFTSSLRSRLQYLGPTPGLPALTEENSSFEDSLDPSKGPVDAFCLLVFDPEKVDYLNLKKNQRLSFTLKNNNNEEKCWTSDYINP